MLVEVIADRTDPVCVKGADMQEVELKPCPFCGHKIDLGKDMYEPSRDWHPTVCDHDSGGDPINIHCKCGLEFSTGTYDYKEFVDAWNRRACECI